MTTAAAEKSVTVTQIVRRFEVTKRQLQTWDETGVLKPSRGTRGRRRYSAHDLMCIILRKTLRTRGVPFGEIDAVVKYVAKQEGLDKFEWLVTDGAAVELCTWTSDVFDAFQKMPGPGVLINLGSIHATASSFVEGQGE